MRVAIIGHGLIGGSIALALQRLKSAPQVIVLDRHDELDQASGADIIFLAAPIPENIRILSCLAPHVAGEALITDTGSTKRTIIAAADGLPPRLRFIGGHPIAGAATGGRGAARADLFDGQDWILTPDARTRAQDLDALRELLHAIGAHIHLMDASEHDRILAFVSHLPQLAVSALMQTVGSAVGDRGLAVAGDGLRDTSRLAASPADVWQGVVDSNRDHVNAALEGLIAALQSLRDNAGAALPRIFQESAHWKQVLDQRDKP